MTMHEHTPSRHKSRAVTFFHLLISPRKVFTYYMDGANICSVCDAHITVPYFYYSPATKALYALFGLILFLGITKIPYLHFGVSLLGIVLFHHIYSAAVFAFAPWDAYDIEKRSSASCAEEAKRELGKKAFWLIIGFLASAKFCLRVLL